MNSIFGDRRTVIILLAPALLVYTLLKVVPVLWSFGLSFFEGNSLRGFTFVGIDNFVAFLGDDAAIQSLKVSVSFAIIATIDSSVPVRSSASSAPTPAEGSVDRIVIGWIRLSYSMPSTI